MLSLTRLSLREIRLPLREPFRISSGIEFERRILLLELESDGVRVWSECVAGERPNYSPETIDTAWLALREWITPRVLRVAFAGPEQVHAVLEKDFRGHRMAKAAVESRWGCGVYRRTLRGFRWRSGWAGVAIAFQSVSRSVFSRRRMRWSRRR